MKHLFYMLPRWLAGALVLLSLTPAYAAAPGFVTIRDNPGGVVQKFAAHYAQLAASGASVHIAGMCASACTMVTGMIPAERVCVERGAKFGFHSAFMDLRDPLGTYTYEGTRFVWTRMSPAAQEAVRKRGWNGDTPHPNLIIVAGTELYPVCH